MLGKSLLHRLAPYWMRCKIDQKLLSVAVDLEPPIHLPFVNSGDWKVSAKINSTAGVSLMFASLREPPPRFSIKRCIGSERDMYITTPPVPC